MTDTGVPIQQGLMTTMAMIPAGESYSDAIDLTDKRLVSIHLPESWNEAPLTFEVSTDGATSPYRPLYRHDGHSVSVVVPAGNVAVMLPDYLGSGLGFVRLRSGTREHPVPQSADRHFVLLTTQ